MFTDVNEINRLDNQFGDAMMTTSTLNKLKLENNIQWYAVRIEVCRRVVAAGREVGYDADLVDILKKDLKLGYNFSEESYLADLNRVELEGKRDEIKLNQYLAERDKRNGTSEAPKVTYQGLAQTTMLMRKAGYVIPSDVNALDWAIACRSFLESAEKPTPKRWPKEK